MNGHGPRCSSDAAAHVVRADLRSMIQSSGSSTGSVGVVFNYLEYGSLPDTEFVIHTQREET